MNGNCHKIGGVCAGVLIVCEIAEKSQNLSMLPLTGILTIGAASIGALIPDVDEPSSKVGRKVKPVSSLIKSTAGHRGVFHSPFIVVILYAALNAAKEFLIGSELMKGDLPVLFYDAISLGLLCGYASHLVLDLLNRAGIPLLWPVSKKKFHLLNLKTNRDEPFVIIMMLLLMSARIALLVSHLSSITG